MQVTVQYNLCNEPWTKYSMGTVADRGLLPTKWTSVRLQRHVLYLETHKCTSSRYPIASANSHMTDRFLQATMLQQSRAEYGEHARHTPHADDCCEP